mgnify:CR=1 FL=1
MCSREIHAVFGRSLRSLTKKPSKTITEDDVDASGDKERREITENSAGISGLITLGDLVRAIP